MKRLYALCVLAALLMLAAPGARAAANGRSYDDFVNSYAENLSFINQNTGRHLLPLVLARGSSDADGGHRIYQIPGDVLTASVRLDATNDTIESCRIVLTSPQGMTYGGSLYNDFVISGYHSYALLMAMHPDSDPLKRYELVEAVNAGLGGEETTFQTQVGLYRLTCTRVDTAATLLFENTLTLSPEDAPETGEPSNENAEEGGYIG